jgi:hypothetical protein
LAKKELDLCLILLYYSTNCTAVSNKEKKMKSISKTTKTFKLFNALQAGEKVTASEASKRFGIKNIAAEASRIRQHGYAVYANTKTAGNNVQVTTYELGRPSREIVALGYMAKSLGMAI